jgi:hypothetical protein
MGEPMAVTARVRKAHSRAKSLFNVNGLSKCGKDPDRVP